MTEWKETKQVKLGDIPSVKGIIDHLEAVKDVLRQQLAKDMASLAEAEAMKKKLQSGQVS